MNDIVYQRVHEQLTRFLLHYAAKHLDSVLAEAARSQPSYLDFLDQVLQQEAEEKQQQRVQLLTKMAKLPSHKTIEQFDFGAQPSIDSKLINELKTARFVAQKENVLLFGPPGVGKTHLAIGLGVSAIHKGVPTLYTTAHTLLSQLVKAEKAGEVEQKMKYYCKPQLLIIDELGYLPMERMGAHLFFQLVTRRYERSSLLLTTNQSISQWGQVFGDDMVAAAILDRLLHHSHTLMIQGESYRLRHKRKAGILATRTTAAVQTNTQQGGQI